MKANTAKDVDTAEVNMSEREALQTGTCAKFMTNKEIRKFFKADFKKCKVKNPVVHDIPDSKLNCLTVVEEKWI